jgi:hypothetical protein
MESMNIYIGGHSINNSQKNPSEGKVSSNAENQGGFLGAAKKMFMSLAPAPPDALEKSAAVQFKKIKDKNKIEKTRTEDDVLKDLDRLIRRIQRSKSHGDDSKKKEMPCKKSARCNDESFRGERKRKGGET